MIPAQPHECEALYSFFFGCFNWNVGGVVGRSIDSDLKKKNYRRAILSRLT